MSHRPIAGAVFMASLLLSACEEPGRVCAGVGYYAVVVTIRDQMGSAQALGATVTLYDGSYTEQDSAGDTLSVPAAEERGGRTYDIQVAKPYYDVAWVRGVHAPGGGCVTGHETSPVTITVPVQLTLAAGAPPVRSLYLLWGHVLLDRPPYRSSWTFTPYLDASAGLPRAVYWRITGDTASVGFDATTGALTYRCLATSGYLTVTAKAVADTTVVGTASVAVQGHPAATGDPPCS